MTMMEAVKHCFSNFATFSGRARRSEYWKFFLFNSLVTAAAIVLGAIFSVAGENVETFLGAFPLVALYRLIVLLPGLAVSVRRLHDLGRSGACLFFVLLPVLGSILLLVWEFQDGQPFTNQYGADPKGRKMGPDGVYYAEPVHTEPDEKTSFTGEREETKKEPVRPVSREPARTDHSVRMPAAPSAPAAPKTADKPVSRVKSRGFSVPDDLD